MSIYAKNPIVIKPLVLIKIRVKRITLYKILHHFFYYSF
jgi:hypothetical protein